MSTYTLTKASKTVTKVESEKETVTWTIFLPLLEEGSRSVKVVNERATGEMNCDRK